MQRERLTITLEPEVITAIDSLIDQQTLRNRSQTIEHLIRQGLGLHDLQKAVLFWENDWSQPAIESSLQLLSSTNIRWLYLALPNNCNPSDLLAVINQAYPGRFEQKIIPIDFGSGSALALLKNQLDNSFLLLWPEEVDLPKSLLPIYTFHRQHRSTLTMMISSQDGHTFHNCNLAIAEPDLFNFIPSGPVSLRDNTFPLLLKNGKVKAYASQ